MMRLEGGVYKAEIEGRELMLGGDFILAIDGVEFSAENLDRLSDIFD